MTANPCPRASAILAARRSAAGLGWTDDDRAHLAGCATCRDAVAVERAFAAVALPASAQAAARHLPPANVVLLRARLAARRAALERSVVPLALWQTVTGAVAVAGGVLALATLPELGLGAATPTAVQLVAGLGLVGLATLPFLGRLRSAVRGL